MNNISKFIPKGLIETKANIEDFITYARNNYMSVIGLCPKDFDLPIWSFDLKLLGSKRAKNAHVKFAKLEFKAPRGGGIELQAEILINENFRNFLKALFLHRLLVEPTQLISDLEVVLRNLEFAVRTRIKHEPLPEDLILDDVHFAAANYSKDAPESAYRRSVLMCSYLAYINECSLAVKKIRWSNPFSKPISKRMDMSAEAAKKRQEKMPSLRSLHVILQMAIWALEDQLDKQLPIVEKSLGRRNVAVDLTKANETFAPRVLGIALSVLGLNCRISELVHMPSNPESFTLSKGELDDDGVPEDEDRFALKWLPVKGGNPMVKPFAKNIAPLVELIINKLKSISQGPRELALYYEKNPQRLYLPENLEYLRSKQWLSQEMLSLIIGVLPRGVLSWAKSNSIEMVQVPAKQPGRFKFVYSFKSVESYLLSLLPKSFPYINGNLKYSNAMFTSFYKQSAYNYKTCYVMIDYFDQQVFEKSIGLKDSEPDHKTIFEYFGFYEENADFINLDTHEFRHLWQTLLKHAGVSESIAAYAAGRRDKRQNANYDERPPKPAAELSFSIIDKTKSGDFKYSALAIAHEVLSIAVKAESLGTESIVSYGKNSIVTFGKENGSFNVQGCHMTEYGVCRHNYVSSGCPKFKQCLECDELYCIKGIKSFEYNARVKAEELRKNLVEYKKYLLEDKADEVDGVDKWLSLTTKQLAKLDLLINDFFNNSSVPLGSVVQVSPELQGTSALADALVQRLGELMINRPIGLG